MSLPPVCLCFQCVSCCHGIWHSQYLKVCDWHLCDCTLACNLAVKSWLLRRPATHGWQRPRAQRSVSKYPIMPSSHHLHGLISLPLELAFPDVINVSRCRRTPCLDHDILSRSCVTSPQKTYFAWGEKAVQGDLARPPSLHVLVLSEFESLRDGCRDTWQSEHIHLFNLEDQLSPFHPAVKIATSFGQ